MPGNLQIANDAIYLSTPCEVTKVKHPATVGCFTLVILHRRIEANQSSNAVLKCIINTSQRHPPHMTKRSVSHTAKGFTLIELLIVIVGIGILSSLILISFNGIRQRAQSSVLQNDLNTASKTLAVARVLGAYPVDLEAADLKKSPGTVFEYHYKSVDNSYCLSATNSDMTYFVTSNDSKPREGTCSSLSLGLTGWWKLDGTANDYSGAARHGTIVGASPTADRDSTPNSAYDFHPGSYITIGTNPITGSHSFTLAAWISTRQLSNYSGAIAIGSPPSIGGGGAYIGTVSGAQYGSNNSIGGGFYGYNIGSGITIMNQWVHVAMTFDNGSANQVILYVNGSPTVTASYAPILQSQYIHIGRIGNDPSYDFNGFIDDVRLYDRALSASEISELYSSDS